MYSSLFIFFVRPSYTSKHLQTRAHTHPYKCMYAHFTPMSTSEEPSWTGKISRLTKSPQTGVSLLTGTLPTTESIMPLNPRINPGKYEHPCKSWIWIRVGRTQLADIWSVHPLSLIELCILHQLICYKLINKILDVWWTFFWKYVWTGLVGSFLHQLPWGNCWRSIERKEIGIPIFLSKLYQKMILHLRTTHRGRD